MALIERISTVTNVTIVYIPSRERQRQFQVFALDDITIRPGLCSHRHDYTYTFTLGYEDLDFETIQPLTTPAGELVMPKLAHPNGVPPVDHTTNTERGTYFLFMNTNRFVPTTYVSTLTMNNLPAQRGGEDEEGTTCVRFAYQMAGTVIFNVVLAQQFHAINDYHGLEPIWEAKL